MSLPKEPRQKMINMMYLVLTALLALNVSTEVLEAFKTVDKSIITSNNSINTKNKVIYDAFVEELKDGQTKAKAEIWAPKANTVKKLSNDLSTYIDNMKLKLKQESGLKVDSKGVEEFKEDDLDAATRLFAPDDFDKGEGKVMYDKLQAYKKDVLAVLNPNDFKDNPTLQREITAKRAEFEKTLPLDLTVPEKAHAEKSGNNAKDWTFSYFHMTPTIASLTILSKFQNDVKNSESQMVDYIHSQIGKVKLVFDQFQAIAQASRTYAMPGEEIEITAGVGAFSAAAKPKIYVAGQLQNLTPEGTAAFKTTASGAGEHTVDVRIEFIKPDGTPAVVNKPVKYTVGTPSGASVFLEKMNVLYIGVENPMTISAGSAGREKMSVSISNGNISSAGGDRFIAKPTSQGIAKINVTVNGKTTPFEMRVKRLPNPTAMVGDKTGGIFSAASFKAQGGLFAKLLDTDFEAPFTVLGYTVAANTGIYREVVNEGARWSTAADALIKQTSPGSQVFFDKIRVKGPDGIVRELPGIFFNLK
jgi:gliding motility-associated protein GldM